MSPNARPLMSICLTTVFAAMLLQLSGCGEPEPRVEVSGTVQMDGAPMERGLITLIPQAPTEGPKVTGTIVDGNFVIGKDAGPYPGTFLIKIETVPREIEAIAEGTTMAEAFDPSLPRRPQVDAKYNRDSKKQVEVVAEGDNTYEFAVESTKS